MPNKLTGNKAEQRVMEDLVNALLAEQFLDGHVSIELLTKEEWLLNTSQDDQLKIVQEQFGAEVEAQATHVYRWKLEDAVIVFPVSTSITQPYRFEASYGVYKVTQGKDLSRLGPLELMGHAVALYANDPVAVDPYGAVKFLHMIEQTLLQTSFSLENEQPSAHILDCRRRLLCWRQSAKRLTVTDLFTPCPK